ncbi:uncharacterized protein N7506_012330 [Penicillium brevicompactum]|uniref:uncharacterized protein n=1 Tax=Penicillium brevicompactum TaxID=5074 RepID=UPI002541F433|nr:uncharacterized protein N7506_012330 [Penicillium brevicompactum]KAJ5319626.1 hypothetical protein N7506_012330 [Penicillium brevicompactum]
MAIRDIISRPKLVHTQLLLIGRPKSKLLRDILDLIREKAQYPYKEDIEKALKSLLRDLNKTYKRLFESIPIELKNNAIRLLQFLIHSKRSLTLAKVKEVIATKIKNHSRGFYIKCRLFYETNILAYYPSLMIVVHTKGLFYTN